jgi:hypothetical protein
VNITVEFQWLSAIQPEEVHFADIIVNALRAITF